MGRGIIEPWINLCWISPPYTPAHRSCSTMTPSCIYWLSAPAAIRGLGSFTRDSHAHERISQFNWVSIHFVQAYETGWTPTVGPAWGSVKRDPSIHPQITIAHLGNQPGTGARPPDLFEPHLKTLAPVKR